MTTPQTDAFRAMDRMYRYQRYIYDPTRKFYLLGRDRLLDQMPVKDGDRVLEIGCGTGRNLTILAERYPHNEFYGLDASQAMLESAIAAAGRKGLTNMRFATALAQDFGFKETFELEKPFDHIFFSYAISMIPPWKESITNALANVRPGGTVHIVDFYDQKRLPAWFRSLLRTWLRQFHVQFWDDLIPFLEDIDKQGIAALEMTAVARRYAFIASLHKAG
ncbi:MAG: class I SAM-dependent methyltransferase [Pyrinomonadaceae bacterium]